MNASCAISSARLAIAAIAPGHVDQRTLPAPDNPLKASMSPGQHLLHGGQIFFGRWLWRSFWIESSAASKTGSRLFWLHFSRKWLGFGNYATG